MHLHDPAAGINTDVSAFDPVMAGNDRVFEDQDNPVVFPVIPDRYRF